MSSEFLLALLGTGGVSVFLGAVVQAIFSRRKLSAEATSIISEAAGGIVQRLETENLRIIADNQQLRARVTALEVKSRKRDDRDEELEEAVRIHLLWDQAVVEKLQEAGITVPPAPPLLPPEG